MTCYFENKSVNNFEADPSLCGEDKYTEKSFEHRLQWVVERMHYLALLFNIDICAYAPIF